MASPAKQEIFKRIRAKKDFKSFVLLKWERYEKKPFMDNWHYDYLCKILEHTLPNNLTSGNHLRDSKDFKGAADSVSSSTPKFTKSPTSNTALVQSTSPNLQNLNHTQNPNPTQKGKMAESRLSRGAEHWEQGGSSATANAELERDKRGSPLDCRKSGDFFGVKGSGEGINPFLRKEKENTSNDSSHSCEALVHTCQKDNAKPKQQDTLITRLMLNMPPSYGKTEIIARCFIAWALGNYPQRKFIYISYSDELCRKISNQVRDLIKSPFFASVFGKNPLFLQDNANEFVLKEGGGLFVTTLKSAITGFHAHQILIDDPIKVSAMNSKAERNLVNQNFKESVLSRLQDNKSNITILMQRLGDEDLCGFLLDKKNFESHIIDEWKQISLKAINKERETYTIGDYNHIREPNTPLFPQRHNNKDLELLKLQMGEDEFSTQYLQEPMVSEAGFFELAYFKEIPSYECQNQNLYIFVDSALSLNANADNRAIVLIGVENYENTLRYVVRDCVFGIWEESQTIQEIISLMLDNPKAKVYIESDGGGLTLERLLLSELVRVNNQRKINRQSQITNSIKCYTPSRKVSKIEKIKALKPFYNTGFLVFLHNARGLAQIKKELLGFNPAKPFRKDDCIDCIASCVAHSEVIAPSFGAKAKESQSPIERLRQKARSQRVAWNF